LEDLRRKKNRDPTSQRNTRPSKERSTQANTSHNGDKVQRLSPITRPRREDVARARSLQRAPQNLAPSQKQFARARSLQRAP